VIPVTVEGNSRELGPFLFCIYARIEGRERERKTTRGEWLELTWRPHQNMKYSRRNNTHVTRTTNWQRTQFQKAILGDDFKEVRGK
jgi:hypothetical protein